MTDYLIINGNNRTSIEFKLNGKISSKSCGSSSSSSSTCEDNEYNTNQIKTEPVMSINEDDDYEDSVDDLAGSLVSSKSSLDTKSLNANNQANRRKQHKPIR